MAMRQTQTEMRQAQTGGFRPGTHAPAPGTDRVRAYDYWRINVDQAWEMRFWTRDLNCTERALRDAVAQVGNTAASVRMYLARNSRN